MEKNGKIIEINQHVRDALNLWADITLEMEAKQWAYMMDYFPPRPHECHILVSARGK